MTSSIATLTPDLPGYPGRLAALGWKDTLYLRGSAPPAVPTIAIVGARAATGRGMSRATELAAAMVERGRHVVSGGALGIDGAAHRGALASTTVVLGCGVDVAYPSRHASLFAGILTSGGGLVSTLLPGTQPRRHTFVARNPLIAALADAVIVVEAELRSGSLSTAAAAKRFGRIVCAWPGTPGCDRLIAMGARRIEGATDVEAALAGEPVKRKPPSDPIARQVFDAYLAGARDVDDLVLATGLPVRAILRALSMMENP